MRSKSIQDFGGSADCGRTLVSTYRVPANSENNGQRCPENASVLNLSIRPSLFFMTFQIFLLSFKLSDLTVRGKSWRTIHKPF